VLYKSHMTSRIIRNETMNDNPHVLICHTGYLCEAEKKVVVEDGPWQSFHVQDMGQSVMENLGEFEQWQTVYEGSLEKQDSPMGSYLVGDFSLIQQPGVYRIILPEDAGRSYQFIITDGAYSRLPRIFLDYLHNWRSGDFENEWRGNGHMDDGVRSDTGEQLDVSGGWYDAGDLRKWMTMSNLPILAFMDLYERLDISWNSFHEEGVSDNDLITEAVWGIEFVMKMQDQGTGMFFEEIGAGGFGRAKEGMTWWYENHSGCLADNSENRFTDNIPNTGDERTIRAQYNPVVQYINIAIMERAAQVLKGMMPELSLRCHKSAVNAWQFVEGKKATDKMHDWTVVRSWRLIAGQLLFKSSVVEFMQLERMMTELVDLQDKQRGHWYMDCDKNDPYRGILHSAQPLIALCGILEDFRQDDIGKAAEASIARLWNQYVKPMMGTNPFGILPYGLFYSRPTEQDRYHRIWGDTWYRFFLPDHSVQRINHGLAGHWTSWAHGLGYAGFLLENKEMTNAAWGQLYWEFGYNPLNICLVTGVGYNNPMPHSRFFGTFPGGFCTGPRGNGDDQIVIDMDKRAEWSSTEYWNTPLSNTLMALSFLLPVSIDSNKKLGSRV
jgi:hypothetical protein